MNANLPDLQNITNYDEIFLAAKEFYCLADGEILNELELTQLAIKLGRQVCAQLTGVKSFENHMRTDHMEDGDLNLFVSFFPAYAVLAKSSEQIEMAKLLFRLYAPFSETGLIRPKALRLLAHDHTLCGLKVPPLWNRKGKCQMLPSEYGYIFGDSAFLNPSYKMLRRKNGVPNALATASGGSLPRDERIYLEADIHHVVGYFDWDSKESALGLVNESILPASFLLSKIHTCVFECVAPRHLEETIDDVVAGLIDIDESDRKIVFSGIAKYSANMIQGRRGKSCIKTATENLIHLFTSLIPFGFEPLAQAREMCGASTDESIKVVDALFERALAIRTESDSDLIHQISWIDAVLLSIDPKWISLQTPSKVAIDYINALHHNFKYRNLIEYRPDVAAPLFP